MTAGLLQIYLRPCSPSAFTVRPKLRHYQPETVDPDQHPKCVKTLLINELPPKRYIELPV